MTSARDIQINEASWIYAKETDGRFMESNSWAQTADIFQDGAKFADATNAHKLAQLSQRVERLRKALQYCVDTEGRKCLEDGCKCLQEIPKQALIADDALKADAAGED